MRQLDAIAHVIKPRNKLKRIPTMRYQDGVERVPDFTGYKGGDTIDARLTPHEAVLNRNAAELFGRERIKTMNEIGNLMAKIGIDLPSFGKREQQDDYVQPPMYPPQYGMGTGDVEPGILAGNRYGAGIRVDDVGQAMQSLFEWNGLNNHDYNSLFGGGAWSSMNGMQPYGNNASMIPSMYPTGQVRPGPDYNLNTASSTLSGKAKEPIMDYYNLPLTSYTPGQGNASMEGGYETASGLPMYTYEDYLAGRAPYVTGALTGPNAKPTLETVYRMIGNRRVPVKITDRGPGVNGQYGLDIASSNPDWATNFPHQGSRDYAPEGPIENYGASQQGDTTHYLTASGTPMMSSGSGMQSSLADYQGMMAKDQNTASGIAAIGSVLGSVLQNFGKQTAANQQPTPQAKPSQGSQLLDLLAQNPYLAYSQYFRS